MKFTVAYFTEGGRLGKSPDMVNPLLSLRGVYSFQEEVSSRGGRGGGGLLIPNGSRNNVTNIYVFTLLKTRGRTKGQKRYVSPILYFSKLIRVLRALLETLRGHKFPR